MFCGQQNIKIGSHRIWTCFSLQEFTVIPVRVLTFANYSIGYISVLQSQLAEQHNLSFGIGPNFQQSPLHSENTKYFITNKGTSGQRNTHAIRLLDESSLGQALQNIRKAKNQILKNIKPKNRKPKNCKPKNRKPKNQKPKNDGIIATPARKASPL